MSHTLPCHLVLADMRFKISTHPPLPTANAWCPLPSSDSDPIPTIRTLKNHLARSLPTVRVYSATADELVLELDGFELLDDSALADLALTNGDVIEYVSRIARLLSKR